MTYVGLICGRLWCADSGDALNSIAGVFRLSRSL